MKKMVVNNQVFKISKGDKGKKATLVGEINKKKKLKSLPNKSISLGGSAFVGRHTTG
jgi:hypothetical protein